ncbi:MAG: STAS domain-containing protein [Phycisphaerales bacterium]|nr:MAG: STAS domain-containing protein [Phycisphaerales bacterium]
MKLKIQDYNDVTVIELHGDLDGDVVAMFQDAIIGIVSKDRVGVVLDMSNVGFIDSEGLEQLLWARDYCNENTRELRLAGLEENCLRILEITRLASEFAHYNELAEAVKSFA